MVNEGTPATSAVSPPRRIEREDGFVVRSATADDLPAILHVLQTAFDRWPPVDSDRTALEYLEWKLSPPGIGLEGYLVCEYEGEVIGCKLRWFGRAWLCGQDRVTDVGSDMGLLEQYHGRGLARFLNNGEELPRPFGEISLERTSRQAAVRHMEVEHTAYDLQAWVRPLALAGRARLAARHGGPASLARVVASAARALVSRRNAASEVVQIEQFDERVDALWLATRDRFDLARVRDAEYLNWRFADPRGGRCILLARFEHAGTEDGALRAFGVFRLAGAELKVLDLYTDPAHPDAGRAVLEAAAERARDQGAQALVSWIVPGDPEEAVHRAAGFVPTDRFPVAYKVPRGVTAPEVEEQLWRPDLRRHITMGDFDFA